MQTRPPEVVAHFPPKLRCLFEPSRYKVLFGGRGGGKSWAIARALLILGTQKPLRVLCAREFMASISDSVHRLLSDQIDALGLGSFYTVEKATISGANGTEFRFAGIRTNVSQVKSFEGITHAWCEEAANVSKASWEVLIPTIRRDKSEIWISLNPELPTDETYRRFVLAPPPGAIVAKVNFDDNPWFPAVLRTEMEYLRDTDPDAYQNIWLGHPRHTVDGAVYANELRAAEADGRITRVPYDPTRPVQTVWDLGWADNTSIWLAQVFPFNEIRLIDFIEGSQRPLNSYLKDLQARPYVYGVDWLPHDARAKQLGTGRSIEELMRAAGRKVQIVPQLSVQDGINAARTVMAQCWFDEAKCADGLQSLRHYRYEAAESGGGLKRVPLHDQASHACLTGDAMVKTDTGLRRIDAIRAGDRVWTPAGYANVTWAGEVKQAAELVTIGLSDGRRLECTPEHKIATSRGFVRADALRYTDKVLSGNEWTSRLIGLYSRVAHTGFRATITAATYGAQKAHPIFTGQFGKAITARCRRVVRSITAMATRLTTTSAILRPSMLPSINGSICLSVERPERSETHRIIALSEPPNGTAAPRGSSGTASMASSHGTSASGPMPPVSNAVRFLLRRILRAPSGAISIARCRISTAAGAPRLVYDLTVESHACYQANGFLVSNSDAFRYLCVALRTTKPRSEVSDEAKLTGAISPTQSWMGT